MFKQKFYLTVFTIYQLFSTALIATGAWPADLVYLNLAIQLAAILLFDLEHALYSVVLTIPFYLAVPNPKFDSLSAWRFTFAALFAVFWWKYKYRGGQKIRGFAWDPSLVWLAAAIIISIALEPFKTVGAKKILFVVNAYLIYLVAYNLITTKARIITFSKTIFTALAMIVLLGYVQFAGTFATTTYHFWQYWATLISRAYYGKTLSDTLVYSNSWFSFYKNAPPALRMFSILPDSHAFAVLAMFSMPFAAALLFFTAEKWKKVLLWIFIALAAAAISFSGTRGVWAGILAPLLVLIYLYTRHWGRKLIAAMFIPLVLFIVFLGASPLIQKGVNAIRSGTNTGNFIERASSIYNLNDPSNAGRIAIWKNTLQFAAKHPLFGAGFGDFVITLDQNNQPSASFQQLAQQKDQAYNLPKQYVTAHNLYLDFLAETGLVGLVMFLFYLKEIFAAFWKFFKAHYLFAADGLIFLAVNLGLYLAWLFAYSLVDGTLLNDRVLMFFFLILAISASIIRVYSEEHGENRN